MVKHTKLHQLGLIDTASRFNGAIGINSDKSEYWLKTAGAREAVWVLSLDKTINLSSPKTQTAAPV